MIQKNQSSTPYPRPIPRLVSVLRQLPPGSKLKMSSDCKDSRKSGRLLNGRSMAVAAASSLSDRRVEVKAGLRAQPAEQYFSFVCAV